MRRSYASVAKNDVMSSSLPSNLLQGYSRVFERSSSHSSSSGETRTKTPPACEEEPAVPINILASSLLVRSRNRHFQSAHNLSSSCSPPHCSNDELHLSQQFYQPQSALPQLSRPAISYGTNHILPNVGQNSHCQNFRGGGSYDKRIVLYKTEMCRTFEETGLCRYGIKCQFAHDKSELRQVARHPRYKTEICKTYWQLGTCPYGKRCCFIHNESEIIVSANGPAFNFLPPSPMNAIPRAVVPGTQNDEMIEETDMESMLGHLPVDMLSML
jgi:Zinc finger C-x8-C-x5-C-x3-H type (and similar)